MKDLPKILHQLTEGQKLAFRSQQAIISLRGPDAKDFLQRMSTNDLSRLTSTHPLITVFTNNKGGLIDFCAVYEKAPDSFILVSSHADAKILVDWIERFHFVEDFSVLDETGHHDPVFIVASTDTLPESEGFKFWQAMIFGLELGFYLTFLEPKNYLSLDEPSFETLRIAALMPGSRHEIREDFMPQNVNLLSFVAENKGCYIGQEVIAKAKTYQKRVKNLRGLILSLEEFHRMQRGARVITEDNVTATVISIAPIFIAGIPQALAMLDATKSQTPDPNAINIKRNALFEKN